MAIFTNSYGFGGNFLTHLERMLDVSSEAYIAVGYTSANTVDRITPKAERICRSGGTFKLLVGTPYFEGLSQSNYDALQSLHRRVSQCNNASEVRLSIDILYHGKIYDFVTDSHSIFAGSSNLSPSGLSGNLEFMSQLQGEDLNVEAQLYSPPRDQIYSPLFPC